MPQRSNTGVFVLVAVVGLLGGLWFGLPGVLVALVLMAVNGWVEPFPELTGPKQVGGRAPQALDGVEQRKVDAFQATRDMRFSWLPGPAWLPGGGVQVSWLGGLWVAGVLALAPTGHVWVRLVSAVAGFAVVVGWASSRRKGTRNPGVTVRDVVGVFGQSRGKLLAAGGAGLVAGGVAGWGAGVVLAGSVYGHLVWPVVWAVAGAVGGVGLGVVLVVRPVALAGWRRLLDVRDEWMPNWRVLKVDPVPDCLSTRSLGGVEATVFELSGGRSSMDVIGLAPKIAPLVGAGRTAVVLPVANETKAGPVPGTIHPNRVELVVWPDDEWPDVGDPQVDGDVLELALRVALTRGPQSAGLGPVIPLEVAPLHVGGGRALWAVDLGWPMGPGAAATRVGGIGAMGITGGMLGDCYLDHRGGQGGGVLYVGDLGGAEVDPQVERELAVVAADDRWVRAWSGALSTKVNPPVMQYAQNASERLANGTEVERWVFAVRDGSDPMAAATPGIESKLATAAAPVTFLTISGWTLGVGPRPGSRHPQAFCVYCSSGRVPQKADDLGPARGSGNQWVLTGHINHAFDSIRQPRPEIVSAKCLTAPDSRGHIWELQLRLYGPVSFGDVRTYAERLRQSMASAWLRVADAEDGCVVFVGADPQRVKLVNPGRDRERIARLDWDQAWVDARVLGVANRAPRLVEVDCLPANPQVQVLDFELVPGLDLQSVRNSIPKLRTNTGNEYIEVRQGPGGANTIRVLCSEEDPMPTLAPFEYEVAASSKRGRWPFGVAVDGSPMAWDVGDDAHLLVAGMSGAGKSVTVQTLLTAMATKPAGETEFYVIDVQKKGADYRFMSDFLSGEAYESREAAALIRAVYARGVERIRRNAELGVGHVKEWPEGAPPQMVLVIDEFTSLITTEQVSRQPFDDPELEATRLATIQDNANRTTIGQYTGKVARELRAAGVTLVLATQQLKQKSLEDIPGGDTLKSSLARMLLGKASFGEMSSALKNPSEAADLGEVVPRGRGLFESSAHYAVPFQTWFEPDTGKLTAAIAAVRAPVVERIDFSRWLPAEVDQGPAITAVSLDDVGLPAGEQVVVDLGTIDLDLADLELFLDGDDSGSDGAVPVVEVGADSGSEAAAVVEVEPEAVAVVGSEPVEVPPLAWGSLDLGAEPAVDAGPVPGSEAEPEPAPVVVVESEPAPRPVPAPAPAPLVWGSPTREPEPMPGPTPTPGPALGPEPVGVPPLVWDSPNRDPEPTPKPAAAPPLTWNTTTPNHPTKPERTRWLSDDF